MSLRTPSSLETTIGALLRMNRYIPEFRQDDMTKIHFKKLCVPLLILFLTLSSWV